MTWCRPIPPSLLLPLPRSRSVFRPCQVTGGLLHSKNVPSLLAPEPCQPSPKHWPPNPSTCLLVTLFRQAKKKAEEEAAAKAAKEKEAAAAKKKAEEAEAAAKAAKEKEVAAAKEKAAAAEAQV